MSIHSLASTPLAASFVLFALTWSSTAHAFPVGNRHDGAERKEAPDEHDLRATDVDFTGIVALSNCSGALVRWKTSSATDQAMVLSNGHCLGTGMPDPDEVVTNVATTRSFRLIAPSGTGNLGSVKADR